MLELGILTTRALRRHMTNHDLYGWLAFFEERERRVKPPAGPDKPDPENPRRGRGRRV